VIAEVKTEVRWLATSLYPDASRRPLRSSCCYREQACSYRRSPNLLERGLPANHATRFGRHTALSFFAGKRAPTGDHQTCWSEACPRIGRHGLAGIPRYRSSRASALLQPISEPVGARLARESGDTVWQVYRVIVLRGQARSYRRSPNLLERGLPANYAPRLGRHTALSFFAGKRAPTSDQRTYWSEACPRIRHPGLAGIPRYRSSRASALLQPISEPVGARLARESGGPVWQAYRVIDHRGQARLQDQFGTGEPR